MVAPKLRFQEFHGVWNNLKYKDVLTIKYGKDHKLLNEGIVPVYGTGGVMRYVDQYLHDGESILIGRKGTIDQPKYVNEKFWTVDTLFYTQIKDNCIPLFLYQHALQVNWLGLNEATGVPSLNTTSINNVDIALPPKAEQTKIASFLSAVDEKIAQLSQKLHLLDQYKQGIMQKLFSQQIRFKADDGSEFTEWDKIKLSDVAFTTTGSSNREDSTESSGEYTFFDRSEDIRTSSKYLYDCETLIVPGEGSTFKPKYFKGKFDLHQRAYAIMKFKNIEAKFLYFFIQHHHQYFISAAVGSTVKSLRLPMFQNMPVKLPCLAEQKKIANFLSAIDQKIDVTTEQLEQAKLWKKGLLQQMFV